uniref:C2H2-type domain-containing protein n=2 Tax=Elapinae TaxID=42168 RepID=A0A8C6V963_NAJNA
MNGCKSRIAPIRSFSLLVSGGIQIFLPPVRWVQLGGRALRACTHFARAAHARRRRGVPTRLLQACMILVASAAATQHSSVPRKAAALQIHRVKVSMGAQAGGRAGPAAEQQREPVRSTGSPEPGRTGQIPPLLLVSVGLGEPLPKILSSLENSPNLTSGWPCPPLPGVPTWPVLDAGKCRARTEAQGGRKMGRLDVREGQKLVRFQLPESHFCPSGDLRKALGAREGKNTPPQLWCRRPTMPHPPWPHTPSNRAENPLLKFLKPIHGCGPLFRFSRLLMEPQRSPSKTRLRKRRKKAIWKPERKCPQVVVPNPELHHCDTCGKDIKHQSNFREHQRIHTGERPYQCQHCEKTFTRCADLIKHRLVHSARRPFCCRICGKCFKLQTDLGKHGKVHSDEAPFPCHLCPKHFKRTSCLVKHLRIHTQEKPFACSHCSRRFKWEASVKEHERVHTGERPHRCDQCLKTFTHRSTFLQHQRTHQKYPAFSCKHCPKSFNHKSNLLKHVRRLHSEGQRIITHEKKQAKCSKVLTLM